MRPLASLARTALFRMPVLARAGARALSATPAPGGAPLMPPGPRPFRVLGLQQVAVGGLSKGPLSALWTGLLGLPRVGTYTSAKENVDEDILRLGAGVWAVELDVMQPLRPDVAPKVHEPALNHIGLWVDALPAAVEWLTASGVRFTPGGIRRGASGFDVCFIHPKGSGAGAGARGGEGVLIELVQAPPTVIAAFDAEVAAEAARRA